MRPANPTIAIAARELALRLAELSFPPEAVHFLGVAHVLAGRLSGVFAPNGAGIIDKSSRPALEKLQLIEAPVRVLSWHRAHQADPASGSG